MADYDLYDENITADDPVISDDEAGTPFSEPSGTSQQLPVDHPKTDTNIDPHELYDEGLEGATDADLPGNGYN